MSCKCRIVSSAVFSMKNKSKVKNVRLKRSKGTVGTEHMQNIFSSRVFRHRLMNEKAVAVVVICLCLIAVNRNKRKQSNKLKRLSQHIGNRRKCLQSEKVICVKFTANIILNGKGLSLFPLRPGRRQ